MIKVYFETNTGAIRAAYLVAIFEDDELYNKCLPILEAEAKRKGMIITESASDKDIEKLDAMLYAIDALYEPC
jgi:hypothetical protein